MSVLWFLSVRMEKQYFSHLKKQEFCHIYGCFLDGYVCWSIYLMFFMDVNSNLCLFYGFCQWEWKNSIFLTWKTGIFSHWWLFHGRLCVLVNLFDVFHGCQHRFMSVLWFLSVRMKKQELSHFDGLLSLMGTGQWHFLQDHVVVVARGECHGVQEFGTPVLSTSIPLSWINNSP